jgi:hypothetical protein
VNDEVQAGVKGISHYYPGIIKETARKTMTIFSHVWHHPGQYFKRDFIHET